MRKAAAFALAIAGVGSAVYLLPATQRPETPTPPGLAFPAAAPAPAGQATAPAQPAGRAPVNTAAAPPAPTAQSRVFSPNQPLLQTQSAATAAAPASTAFDPNARKLSSSRPADEDARHELVKDLQRELKRVGCYEGEVNGTWTPAVRKAMAAFTDRVNATLPLDEPDYILLTLVQGHTAQACGHSCPSGQAMNEGGKCMPRAVVAQAVKRAGDKTAAARVEPGGSAETGTVARLQPRPAAAPRASSAWSTVITASPKVGEAPQIAAARPQPPLPGRMAVGAPLDVAAPAADERTRSELVRRKAELAAANAIQRETEAEAARKARLADAEARKEREIQALKQKAAAGKASQIAAIVPPAAPVTPPQAATSDDPEAAAPSRKPVAKYQPAPQPKAEAPAVAAIPAPVRRQAVPRPVPPPYVAARTAPPRPYYATSPAYAPQPTRWTRTIFNDITRVR